MYYSTTESVSALINAMFNHFRAYLEEHVNDAHIKLEACKPVRLEVEKLESTLCKDLHLKKIIWDCGWNVTHYRGCLLSFQALSQHHPESMQVLKDKTLVFANGTGIDIEGNVMLNSGEIRHNWLDVSKNNFLLIIIKKKKILASPITKFNMHVFRGDLKEHR